MACGHVDAFMEPSGNGLPTSPGRVCHSPQYSLLVIIRTKQTGRRGHDFAAPGPQRQQLSQAFDGSVDGSLIERIALTLVRDFMQHADLVRSPPSLSWAAIWTSRTANGSKIAV